MPDDAKRELSNLIKRWTKESPDRNVSVLHRKVNKIHKCSRNTIGHAAAGDHDISVSIVLAILKVIISTKEERKRFVEKHYSEYLEYAREYFENEPSSCVPILSTQEGYVLGMLVKRGSLEIHWVKSFLGESLYDNLLSWLNYFSAGKEKGELLVSPGPLIDIDCPQAAKKIIRANLSAIRPDKNKGDFVGAALGRTTKEAAREVWDLQRETWKKSDEIIRNNPGCHDIMTGNMMKFN